MLLSVGEIESDSEVQPIGELHRTVIGLFVCFFSTACLCVCLTVCVLVITVSRAKMAIPIRMMFEGHRNQVLDKHYLASIIEQFMLSFSACRCCHYFINLLNF